MKYEALLKKAKEKLPKIGVEKSRFEIPKVKGHIEGNKTIIINFLQICSTLHRDPNQLLKYLQRELATPAYVDNRRLILGRKINSELINQKIVQFAKDFVICKECRKPDTQLMRQDRVLFMRCLACGAKHTIKAKI